MATKASPEPSRIASISLRDLHRFLEGTLIGAHVVEASDVYIYLRDEYPAALRNS